jgi:hypothetical protein
MILFHALSITASLTATSLLAIFFVHEKASTAAMAVDATMHGYMISERLSVVATAGRAAKMNTLRLIQMVMGHLPELSHAFFSQE